MVRYGGEFFGVLAMRSRDPQTITNRKFRGEREDDRRQSAAEATIEATAGEGGPSAVIWLQCRVPVRLETSNRYNRTPGQGTMGINSVRCRHREELKK